MATKDTEKTPLLSRRNKKGTLSRSLNCILKLIEENTGEDAVIEVFERAKRNLEAVETAHQAVVQAIEDEERFECGEQWMADVENKYLSLIEENTGVDAVTEVFERAKRNLEAVETAHQAVVVAIEDDERFECEEQWMADVENKYLSVRIEVERYLNGLMSKRNVVSEVNSSGDGENSNTENTNNERSSKTGSQDWAAEETNDRQNDVVYDVNCGNVGNVIDNQVDIRFSESNDSTERQGRSNLDRDRPTFRPISDNRSESYFGFNELKLALELPKAEIAEFNGDPVDYWSFISNFEINVASKLSDDAARLQYLLQLCKGKARSCIESCTLLGGEGYERAKSILKRQFGQPHLILNSLMNNIVNHKPIKTNDGESLWNLISYMLRCHVTLTQMEYVNDLNATSNLVKIQGLLPIYLQTAWAQTTQGILQTRELQFKDLLACLESQAEVLCNMFGRNVGKLCGVSKEEEPRVKVNFVKGKSLKCFACDGEHKIHECELLTSMSYDQKLDIVKTKRLCYRCLFPGH
ncbi:hypothetical protein HOLleu_38564 [Holothuria leucospilota]|uniref:Uncharacterized protein n=1 Tax=Holothuria leucospilota TaxID=206669 RepID=A0A9Q0YH55_HOLLE|nr:hypothetical protein HOLleu_38564 [Holothuria leucospilota]